MLTGLFLAALASALFNASVVLQAMEARAVPSKRGLRLSLLGRLARRPRWLAGVGLSAAAAGLQILALTIAPLTVVQPADAAGLVLLSTVGSRTLGERAGRRELISVVGIILGIVAIVILTAARPADEVSSDRVWPGLLVVAAAAAVKWHCRPSAVDVGSAACRSRNSGYPGYTSQLANLSSPLFGSGTRGYDWIRRASPTRSRLTEGPRASSPDFLVRCPVRLRKTAARFCRWSVRDHGGAVYRFFASVPFGRRPVARE
jgi:hypothetical protein